MTDEKRAEEYRKSLKQRLIDIKQASQDAIPLGWHLEV